MAELDRAEAMALLGGVEVGRVVFSQAALPAVRPVNFAVLGMDVVFRTRGGSPLARALDGNVVAFEADELDPADRTGWSVVVTGLAEVLGPGAEYDLLEATLPAPWAPGAYDRVVRIRVQLVTGRRIPRAGEDVRQPRLPSAGPASG
ncbi:pyridoxamine 5'-phosphate oxidase family protein [Yinghuangia soli]|uniref:Pyridoxamine 5'-phosphate oxidase family protein n=1 Tax=Yinghuangia soli TaxID=2908204 RepID=A0AA41TZL0_9ACTN|nr:pyridoxamine 5'-phosphate oxidase family protein [Yinghuangia soli]MCF2528928.1 pyridoxamine 5'-phosphate oxidase family protein [Yinghuangia soli]